MISTTKFSVILWSLAQMLRYTARRHPAFAARLKERNLVAQIIARDEEVGRWYRLRNGELSSRPRHARRSPMSRLRFQERRRLGADLLTPPINWLEQINAQKDFTLAIEGPRISPIGSRRRLMLMQTAGWKFGTKLRRRHHALLQHGQRRPGLRLCQGRQDRPHDADRFRRQRPAAVDDRGARPEIHAAAQDDARPARPE